MINLMFLLRLLIKFAQYLPNDYPNHKKFKKNKIFSCHQFCGKKCVINSELIFKCKKNSSHNFSKKENSFYNSK